MNRGTFITILQDASSKFMYIRTFVMGFHPTGANLCVQRVFLYIETES